MKKKFPDPNKMKRVKGPRLSAEQLLTAKIRVTTFLDEDVLQALKETAQGSGTRYQTLLNQLLRQALIGDTKTILERLEKLEKAVFKSRAA
jgi:uncharacterized protein (DUF4415 family)